MGDMVAFPKSISDLDNCQKVLMYGEELGRVTLLKSDLLMLKKYVDSQNI
jgi:hypothetical protein